MKYDEFINSTEYKKVYDEIIPLGFDCDMCFAVKGLFLRQHSYPLDWGRVVEENDKIGFRRKIEFLCTNFKNFINESDLGVAYDNYSNVRDIHIPIYNKFNGMHFYHDFPKGKTIAESYPEVRAKYDRRIKRLMDLINSGRKICLVFYASFAQLPTSEIMYLTEIFYKIFPNSNVDFLILQNNQNITDDIVYEELSQNIRRVFFYDEISENGVALKSGCNKLKCILNALVKCFYRKQDFKATELNSDNCVDNAITNPSPDFKGLISFGPYMPLDFGNHGVTVDYDVTENYAGFVDVACDHGDTIILPKTELPHNTNKFKFDFNLDKNVTDLEVRFYCEPSETIDENNKFKLFGIHVD